MDKRTVFTAIVTEIHASKVTKGLYFAQADTQFGPIKLATRYKHEVGEEIRVRHQKLKASGDILVWEEVRK